MTKNYAELIQGINQGIPDNDQGLVSPADIRQNMIDLADWASELPDIENVKGAYNASTNTPTLTATPDTTFNDGAYYDVTVSGVVGFAGSNFTSGTVLNIGDKLKKKGTQWYLVPKSDLALEKSIENGNLIDKNLLYPNPIRTDTNTAFWSDASLFNGYAFGYIPTESVSIPKVDFFLQNVNAANRIELSVYKRPVANKASTTAIGSLSGDVLIFSKTYLATLFQNTSALQQCSFDFDKFTATSDFVYVFLIKARDSSTGYINLGCGRFSSSVLSQSERGFYVQSNGTTITALNTPDSVAKVVYAYANRIDKTDANVTANTSNIIGLETSVKYYKSISELPRVATWGYSTFSGFDFGFIPTSSQTCRKVDLDLLGVNQNTSLVLSIYKRLVANATSTTPISTTSTPALTGDELVLTKSYLASQFQNIDTVQTCSFEFPEITMNNSYVYIFRIQAINNFSVGRLGSGRLTTSLTQAERGFVANTTGVFTTLNSGDTVARKFYTFDLVSNKLQAQIDENKSAINQLKYDKALIDYTRIATWAYSAFSGFDFGYIPTINTTIKRVDLDLLGVNQNEKLTLLVYRRDVANAPSTSTIGNLANDTLLFSKDYLSSQFQNTDLVQTCQFVFDEIPISTSYIYIFRLQAVATGGAIGRLGSGRLLITATQGERGWYRNTSGTYLALSLQDAVAKKIYTADFVTNKLTEDVSLLTPEHDSYDDVLVNYSVSGLTINLANTYLVSDKAKSILSTPSIVFDATQSFTVTLTGVNLIYNSNQSAGVFASLALTDGTGNRVKNITNCVVKRNDNQAVLVENVDYKLFTIDGRIAGVNASVASLLVDVTFTYTTERTDIVCIDTTTKSAIIVKGTQRKYDAIEEIYRAQKPSNTNFKILDVIVRGNSISVLNTYKWQGVFKKGKESELLRDISFGRRQLKKTLAKLNKGQNIVLASYAHSIYANQSQQPAYSPNGQYRDRIEWFQLNYPSDFTSQLALYDTGDGAGLKHVRLSPMWHLKKYIEDSFGVSIEYQNYSIGGTNSTNTELNALFPARLAEITSRAPDLVFLNFAINEVSATYSYDNYTQIITALKNVGCEIIVWAGIESTNAVFNMDRTALVKKSNQLKQVAVDTGCAYIPVMYFLDEDFLGVDSQALCAQNAYNHPGVWEHKKMGEILTILF